MIYLGILASVVGIFVSHYIRQKKEHKKPLMCPRNANCDQVVNSPYSKTFGIANTTLGRLYYDAMFILFTLLLIGISFPLQLPLMIMLSFGGMAFSLYLIYIQAFVLRAWCLWCLTSALCATTIFFALLLIR